MVNADMPGSASRKRALCSSVRLRNTASFSMASWLNAPVGIPAAKAKASISPSFSWPTLSLAPALEVFTSMPMAVKKRGQ